MFFFFQKPSSYLHSVADFIGWIEIWLISFLFFFPLIDFITKCLLKYFSQLDRQQYWHCTNDVIYLELLDFIWIRLILKKVLQITVQMYLIILLVSHVLKTKCLLPTSSEPGAWLCDQQRVIYKNSHSRCKKQVGEFFKTVNQWATNSITMNN